MLAWFSPDTPPISCWALRHLDVSTVVELGSRLCAIIQQICTPFLMMHATERFRRVPSITPKTNMLRLKADPFSSAAAFAILRFDPQTVSRALWRPSPKTTTSPVDTRAR